MPVESALVLCCHGRSVGGLIANPYAFARDPRRSYPVALSGERSDFVWNFDG